MYITVIEGMKDFNISPRHHIDGAHMMAAQMASRVMVLLHVLLLTETYLSY